MYEAGDVPCLVATDAIGMGLNLDIEHVAFAALRKFDGRKARGLHDTEVAQIAGRAGRFRRDGTFGTTGRRARPLTRGHRGRGGAELVVKETGEVKEQELFLGDLPLMTGQGTFIINGAERVVVLAARALAGRLLHREQSTRLRAGASPQAKLIPNRGAWLEFETSNEGRSSPSRSTASARSR